MKSLSIFAALVALSTVVGCAAQTDATDSTDGDDQAISLAASAHDLVPGDFKLYDLAVSTPSTLCQRFSGLSLTQTSSEATATLTDAVVGACHIAVPANKRSYRLRETSSDCGTKVFEGSRRVAFSITGNDADNFANIKITDNRARTCATGRVAGPIVVEETTAKIQGGATQTTRVLPDAEPACSTLDVTTCNANLDRCKVGYSSPVCNPGEACSHAIFAKCEDKPAAAPACSTLDESGCSAARDRCSATYSTPPCAPGTACSQIEMFSKCVDQVVPQ